MEILPEDNSELVEAVDRDGRTIRIFRRVQTDRTDHADQGVGHERCGIHAEYDVLAEPRAISRPGLL